MFNTVKNISPSAAVWLTGVFLKVFWATMDLYSTEETAAPGFGCTDNTCLWDQFIFVLTVRKVQNITPLTPLSQGRGSCSYSDISSLSSSLSRLHLYWTPLCGTSTVIIIFQTGTHAQTLCFFAPQSHSTQYDRLWCECQLGNEPQCQAQDVTHAFLVLTSGNIINYL